MGYDMRMVDPPTAEEAEVHASAQRAFNDACAVRDAISGRNGPEGARRDVGTSLWPQMVERGELAKLQAEHPDWVVEEEIGGGDIIIGRADWVAAAQEVHRCYMELHRSDVTYFRLNGWGMGHACDALRELGVIHAYGKPPAWPESSDDFVYDVKVGEDEWVTPLERPDLFSEAEVAYASQVEELLRYSPECPGIPSWKFGTNDGWHVTPIDIQGGLANLCNEAKAAGLDRKEYVAKVVGDRTYVVEFLNWMTAAVGRGGFRVH